MSNTTSTATPVLPSIAPAQSVSVAPPPPPRYSPESYYGLLTDPVGRYGKASWGASNVITLRGSDQFITQATNLFSSFAPPARLNTPDGNSISVHRSDGPDCAFFCMSLARARKALETYFYCQLAKTKAARVWLHDTDGNVTGVTNANEGALEIEAQHLARSFITHYLPTDYAAIPAEYGSPYGRGLGVMTEPRNAYFA
jgi:hypothetical protein